MESIYLTWKKDLGPTVSEKVYLSCWRQQISSLHQYGENRSYSDSINQRSEITMFPNKIPVSLDVNYGRCLIFVLEFRRVIQTVHHINSSGVFGLHSQTLTFDSVLWHPCRSREPKIGMIGWYHKKVIHVRRFFNQKCVFREIPVFVYFV